MARIVEAQGREAEAASLLEQILRDYPDFAPAYDGLARLHLRHGRLESATTILRIGAERAPRDPVILNNLGMCHVLRGEWEQAAERFTLAAAVVPHDARTRANLATALGMLGRTDEALSLYLQVLPPAKAVYNLGVLLEERKDRDGAKVAFERSRALEPGS
jgi:Flp pilus assembly protein TadD